jgi:hypothetical protein
MGKITEEYEGSNIGFIILLLIYPFIHLPIYRFLSAGTAVGTA